MTQSTWADSRAFYPVYRGTGEAIARLEATRSSGNLGRLIVCPAILLLRLFVGGFAVAERAISRVRELAADQASVEAASAGQLGSALVKLHAFTKQRNMATAYLYLVA